MRNHRFIAVCLVFAVIACTLILIWRGKHREDSAQHGRTLSGSDANGRSLEPGRAITLPDEPGGEGIAGSAMEPASDGNTWIGARLENEQRGGGAGFVRPPVAGNAAGDGLRKPDPNVVVPPEPPRLDLAELLVGKDLTNEAVRKRVEEHVQEVERLRLEWARAKALSLGIEIRIEGADGSFQQLHDFDGDIPVYRATLNSAAAISTNVTPLFSSPYNLTGSGFRVGVWDGGSVRGSHREFGNRVILGNSSASLSSHATHVAGTIAASGVSSWAKGMAPEVSILSYDWDFDISEMMSNAAVSPLQAGKVTVSNHSYGFLRGYSPNGSGGWTWRGNGNISTSVDINFGRYDQMARDYDAFIHSYPYQLVVVAAANDRNHSPSFGNSVYSFATGSNFTFGSSSPRPDGEYKNGYDCAGDKAVAKNTLTVGATYDAVFLSNRFVPNAEVTTFTSWGPTDDGRIKPDVMGNGFMLDSPISSGNSNYGTSSGTSMAAPNVAGSAVLLNQLYAREFPGQQMRSSTLKALIIHTADDLGRPGPDYQTGWGLMNTKAAADLIIAHKSSAGSPRIIEGRVTNSDKTQTRAFQWVGSGPIRATLAWNDPAGTEKTGHDNRSRALVHDLDLTITGPSGTVHHPFVMPHVGNWSLSSLSSTAVRGTNTVDNVEQVLINAPEGPGIYTVRVNLNGNLAAGHSDQWYSLILSGNSAVAADTRIVEITGDLNFGNVTVGQSSQRTMTIRNNGNSALSVGSINYPSGFSGNWSGGSIAAGATRDVAVTFSPTLAQSYSGSVVVNSNLTSGSGVRAVSGVGVAANTVATLSNGVAVNSISGALESVRYYKITVPSGQSSLRIEISGGTGDCDLYVRRGAIPTFSEYDARPYLDGNNETVIYETPTGGEYFIMLHGYAAYSGVTLRATYEAPVVTTRVIRLSGSLEFGNAIVGSTATRTLTVHNDGNSTLNVSGITYPSGFSGSWSGGNIAAGASRAITVTFAPNVVGVFSGQVSVASNALSGSGVTPISGSGITTINPLSNGVPVTGLVGLTGANIIYRITVPPSQTKLEFRIYGGTGDCDMFVRRGAEPTDTNYDHTNRNFTNNETITINNPAAGDWFVLLSAASQFTGVTLLASYEQVVSTRVIRLTGSMAFGGVRIGDTVSRDLTIHNDGNSPLTVSGASFPPGYSGSHPSSVPANGSRNMRVFFTPVAAVSYPGSITISSNKTSGTDSAPVSGSGLATLTVNPPEAVIEHEPKTVDLTVSADSSWNWTVVEGAAWISSQMAPSQSGSRVLTYQAAENTLTSPRTGRIRVTQGSVSRDHLVLQSAAPPLMGLSRENHAFSASGGTSSIEVTSNQTWTWNSSAAWLTAPGEAKPQTGNQNFGFTASANPDTAVRSATITFTQGNLVRVLTVVQAGGQPQLGLNASSVVNLTAPHGGGTYHISVTSNGTWTWKKIETLSGVVLTPDWINAPGEAAQQTGNQTFSVVVSPNANPFPRAGNVVLSHLNLDRAINIQQAGAPAAFSLSHASANLPSGSGGFDLGISSNTKWQWYLGSAPWLRPVGQSEISSGNGTFRYAVDENPSTSPRSTTITFLAGDGVIIDTHTVTQAGAQVFLTVTPPQTNLSPDGGGVEFQVASNTGWSWTLTGGSGWLTTSEATSQQGTQVFSFSVAPNGTSAQRSATITFTSGALSSTHTVIQTGTTALDAFRISQLNPVGPDVLISFPTKTGKTYRIQSSGTLQSNAWTNRVTGIAGTGGVVTRILNGYGTANHSKMFFRVVEE